MALSSPPSPISRPPRQTRRGAAPPPKIPSSSAGGISPKRLVWTGAFAAVTIVGAIYGAGLKTQQEFHSEKQKIIESTPEDRIRDLEARRAALVTQKMPLERKLRDLRVRMEKDAAAAAAATATREGDGNGKNR
ncbi:hypothetical protein F5Y04DRAFT_277919 [Hypomontagnella monticulosa]|nr:hypothetical protein F5Y04DRAFT_277919 [Hypomontagnella monticulosa]